MRWVVDTIGRVLQSTLYCFGHGIIKLENEVGFDWKEFQGRMRIENGT
jgi:hypothetical protein